MVRRDSTHYDSPRSKIPDHIFERWAREDGEEAPKTKQDLQSEIIVLKANNAKLRKEIITLRETARAALDALSDWDDFGNSLPAPAIVYDDPERPPDAGMLEAVQ